MKPIIEKVLASGLVDEHMAKMMEFWGYLPDGASQKVNSDALQNATKEQLHKLAEDLAIEIEKEHKIRETALDLDKLRWPVVVTIYTDDLKTFEGIYAVIDRMGRYYFRIQDIKEYWFTIGNCIRRTDIYNSTTEAIVERQVLYIGLEPVCMQISTFKGA